MINTQNAQGAFGSLSKNARLLVNVGKMAFEQPFLHGASTVIAGAGVAGRVAQAASAGIGGVAKAISLGAMGSVGAGAVMLVTIPLTTSLVALTGRESAIAGAQVAAIIMMFAGGVIAASLSGNSIGLEHEVVSSVITAGLKAGIGGVAGGAILGYLSADVIAPAVAMIARSLGYSEAEVAVFQAAVPNAIAAIIEEIDNLTE